MLNVKINRQVDKVKDVGNLVKDLSRIRVMVGVPEEKTERPTVSGEVTNAELVFLHTHGVRQSSMRTEMGMTMRGGASYRQAYALYLHTHGSPLWQIPPRPIIEPALRANRDALIEGLRQAASAQLDTTAGQEAALRKFWRVAMMGQNFVRGWFTDARNGWAPNAPSTIARKGSDRPLIDTGELRKSIIGIVARV